MEAKKHPALLSTLVGFGLVAVTGVALAFQQASRFAGTERALKSAETEVARLLTKEPVALTAENVERAKETLQKFRVAEAEHRAELAGGPGARFDVEFKGDPGELGSEIKECVERWHAKFKAEAVPVVAQRPADFAFGFSRYYQTGVNPTKALPAVYRQTKIIDFLLKTLLDSKLKEELRFLGLERQPVELVGVNVGSFNKDEIPALHDAAFRHDGLLRTESFRIRFIARTEVIRRFVNAITDAHRPLCVRGVEVTAPTKEQLAPLSSAEPGKSADAVLPAAFFADAAGPSATAADPAKSAESATAQAKPEVVIESTPSVVTITFAYLESVKPEAPPASGTATL